MPDALCRVEGDPLWWFPPPRVHAGDLEAVVAAQLICERCPELVACGDWAVDHDEWGIWGGVDRSPSRAKPVSVLGRVS